MDRSGTGGRWLAWQLEQHLVEALGERVPLGVTQVSLLSLEPRCLDAERRDSLVLPNLKNPSRLTRQVFRPAGQMDLPGALLIWPKEHGLADGDPLFFSHKRSPDGRRRPISRQQVWEIVRTAADRANVRVLALRVSSYGQAGEPAPVHPHLFRHARVRIVRSTKSLPIAQKQAGWSRLQLAYLTAGDDEVRDAMKNVRG